MEKLKSLKPNAFKNTFCVFNELDINKLEGLDWSYKSKSGSCYFFSKSGMYRYSNHWGRLANSKWRLIPLKPETPSKFKLGFATWTSFYPDNNEEALYYLEVDYEIKTVNYQHKNNPDYDGIAIIRNTFETTKKIKQIRNLFNLTSWFKYFDADDIDLIRKKIIQQLVYTNKSLDEIKNEINGQE